MFRDVHRDKVWNEIRQHDMRAFSRQLTPMVFAEAARRAGVVIAKCPLNLVNLVWLGIASAMHCTANFAFVLTTTLKILEDQRDFGKTPLGRAKKKAQKTAKRKGKSPKRSKHDPRRGDPTQVSEEAFCQARKRMPLKFWMELLTILAGQFQRDHARHCNVHGFRLLAIDGTTLPLQNLKELRDHFGVPKNGKRRRALPQARMVMLTLPGVRIPIAYEAAPLANSELTLAERLLKHMQANDLLLMDRGFFSYGMFWAIQQRGAYFGTRLKSNIKYKKVKCLGTKDWLVEWTPKDSRGCWKRLHLPQSIKLRVIHYQFRGFRANAIVTNVLDPKRLSRDDWVRMASDCDDNGKLTPGLYHRRWEIETSYFELKVSLKLKSLRSRTPESVQYEIAGSVIYYLLIRWLIVLAAEKHGIDPLRISFTAAVQELKAKHESMMTNTPDWVRRVLLPRLLDLIASHTVPLRPGRHYARPNDTKAKDKGHGCKQAAAKLNKSVNTNRKNKKRKTKKQT